MNQHGSNEPSIVHLHSGHRVLDDQATPLSMDVCAVGQESKAGFDYLGARIGFGARQAEAVLGDWSSAHIPELDEIPRRVTELFATSYECVHSAGKAPRASVVTLINAFATEGRGREVWKVLPHLCQSIERRAELLYAGLRGRLCTGEVFNHVMQVCVERDTFRLRLIIQRCFDFRFEFQPDSHDGLFRIRPNYPTPGGSSK